MKVNNKYLRAIRAFASVDETRWAINGVRFEPCPGGYLMVATDGRKLAVLFNPTEDLFPEAFTLANQDLNFIPAKIGNLDISINAGKIEIVALSPDYMPKITCDATDAVYPKWRQVIPKTPFSPLDITISRSVYRPFIDSSRLICPESEAIYLRCHGEPCGPISVFNGNRNFYGIIMPMKAESNEKTIPKWLEEKA